MIWQSLQYGWNVNYWATVAGLPVVWSEAAVNDTLPSGFTSCLSLLSIDRSAEVGQSVNRTTGMGQGLPLTFSILSAPGSATWMQSPSATTVVTGTVQPADPTIYVKDTSAFPAAPGTIYIGLEAMSYSSMTSTTFTISQRGCFGTLPSSHYVGTLGGTVTNRPRIWRGREVRLYAAPMAPDGTATGSTLADESVEVWRGTIDQGPYRDGNDKFTFEALALDRALSNPLPAGATGVVMGSNTRAAVFQTQWLRVTLEAYDSSDVAVSGYPLTIYIQPFSAMPWNSLKTVDEQIALVQAAWNAVVTDLSAPVISIGVNESFSFDPFSGSGNVVKPYITIPVDSSISKTVLTVEIGGYGDTTVARDHEAMFWGPHGIGSYTNPQPIMLGFKTGYNILTPLDPQYGFEIAHFNVAVQMDDPTDAIPLFGTCKIGDQELAYMSSTEGNIVYLSELTDVKAYTDPNYNHPWIPPTDVKGQKVEFHFNVKGTPADVARTLLESSGTATLRGAYDTGGYGEGYAIQGGASSKSAVDEASFDVFLNGSAVDMKMRVGGSSVSFQDMFSGLLTLAQRGLVARPDASGNVRLGVVATDVNGSWYKTKITDADLLGYAGDPIASVRKRDPITQIKVSLSANAQSKDPTSVYTLQETSGVLEIGGQVLDLTIGLDGPQPSVDGKIQGWAASILAQGHDCQTIEVRVVPWLDITVGALVRLETTHPALWNFATGTEGYTGQARCLGARRDLAGGALILTLIIQGGAVVSGLCPAAIVQTFTGTGSAPTMIDLEARFLSYMQDCIASESGDPVRLDHYQPGRGNEAGGGYVMISAAVPINVSGTDYCRLVVSSYTLGVALSTSYRSTLTLPATANATGWQRMFAHASDGTFWG